ncbi:MAG: outer membrane protein assembly factor BamB [Proteobacteria bacterium]|nr:outer membrane protein assembly factor BamB [Pseudomonadota bacterium]
MKRIAILLSLAVAVSGCATIKGWFNSAKKENIQPPTALVPFTPTLEVQKLWDSHPTSGAGESGARVRPAYADGKLFVAGIDGDVAALDAATGRTLWSRRAGQRRGFILHHGQNSVRWAGGPAVDGDLLVVGGLEGEVHALDAGSGADRWQAQVSSEVIASPAIADGIVVVRTDDGRLFGLNAADGSRRWVYDRAVVPALSLRGNAMPVVVDGVVYAGEDNGRLVALRLTDGNVLWEQTLAPGEGRTELARLQDLDGGIAFADGVVYAAGYQGMTAALIADSGRPLWTHPLSSYTGVALAATQVFVIDADSQVWALDLRTGASNWKQDGLKYRWLGEAATIGDAIVVGDMEGWVHWLAASDGKFAARVRLSKHAIQAAPLVVGDTVYVEDVDGVVGAYRVSK